MLKVTIKHSGGNESWRIGYFLKALGMVRTDNCYWTEIYQGQNPDSKYVYAVLNVCDKRESTTPMKEWQGKILEFMGLSINEPTAKELKERYALAIVSDNVILHIEKDGLSKAFDLWHELKKHVPDVTIAVLSSNTAKNSKKSDKVTLYTVDYNCIGNCTVGRRFFTSLDKAKEFSEKPLRDKPIKRTYTYNHAKQIMQEQDQLDAWAQTGYYLPEYE